MATAVDGGALPEGGLYSLEAGAYEQDPELANSLLRLFAETTTDAVFVKDLSGRVLLANPAASALFGLEGEALLGKRCLDFYGDSEEARLTELHDRLVSEGDGAARIEEEVLLRSGQRRTLLTHKTPWRDGDGRVLGLVCITRDVTERKELELLLLAKRARLEQMAAEVAAAESRYRTFFEHLTEAVVVYQARRNALGEITGWIYADANTAAEQAYGRPLREMLGKTVAEVLGEEREPKFTAGWQELLRTGERLHQEYFERGRHYSARRFRMSDSTIGVVALDVTELQQLQARVMQTDRLASLGLLSAGVAHEVNNPLAWLSASLEYVQEELQRAALLLPPGELDEAQKAIAAARDGAARIKHVVRDLKTFSGGGDERTRPVRLEAVVESSLHIAGNELRHRARLLRELRPVPLVLGSEARLGQVVLNLLINSAQALPEGHAAEHEVRVSLFTDARGWARLEVKDTGSGIAPEVLPRIFDPFFTTKPSGVGTGLGLSICRNLVTQLGGEIGVESEPGKGALFHVSFPPTADTGEAPAGGTVAPSTPRKARLLVVDDEPAILEAMRRILAPAYEVVQLADAREALSRLSAGARFDLLLCDLMMPAMSGMELHQRLLAVAPDQAARMVLITGGGFTASAREFLARVPNPRLEKPFESEQLRRLVLECLQAAPG